jgi:hypothetical protein
VNINSITTAQRPHTNDTVEQTNRDDRRNRPERVPPQEVGVLENAEHQCQYKGKERKGQFVNVLLRTPATVDLEPPKDTDTDDVLVEEVDDPEGRKEVRKMRTRKHIRLTCSRFSSMTSGHGPTTTS